MIENIIKNFKEEKDDLEGVLSNEQTEYLRTEIKLIKERRRKEFITFKNREKRKIDLEIILEKIKPYINFIKDEIDIDAKVNKREGQIILIVKDLLELLNLGLDEEYFVRLFKHVMRIYYQIWIKERETINREKAIIMKMMDMSMFRYPLSEDNAERRLIGGLFRNEEKKILKALGNRRVKKIILMKNDIYKKNIIDTLWYIYEKSYLSLCRAGVRDKHIIMRDKGKEEDKKKDEREIKLITNGRKENGRR